MYLHLEYDLEIDSLQINCNLTRCLHGFLIAVVKSKEEGKHLELIQSAPYLTRDIIRESDKAIRKHNTQESQEVGPFPLGDHNAVRNKRDSIIKNKCET